MEAKKLWRGGCSLKIYNFLSFCTKIVLYKNRRFNWLYVYVLGLETCNILDSRLLEKLKQHYSCRDIIRETITYYLDLYEIAKELSLEKSSISQRS